MSLKPPVYPHVDLAHAQKRLLTAKRRRRELDDLIEVLEARIAELRRDYPELQG